jgi:hypothetical protein
LEGGRGRQGSNEAGARGPPERHVCGHRPARASDVVLGWARAQGIAVDVTPPGTPVDDARGERRHGEPRAWCLAAERCTELADTRRPVERRR